MILWFNGFAMPSKRSLRTVVREVHWRSFDRQPHTRLWQVQIFITYN